MICIVILLFVVVGRFYYSVYASEYDCDLSNDDSLNIDDFDSLRIGSYNIKSLNYGKESLEDFNNEFINKMSDDLIKEIDEINEDSTSNKNETAITKDDFISNKSSELIELK